MEEVQSFLCLRCSPKDKWVLVYFSLALDCNWPILEALANISMLNIIIKNVAERGRFFQALQDYAQSQLSLRLGQPEIMFGNPEWWNVRGFVAVERSNNKITLRFTERGSRVTAYWAQLNVKDEFLRLTHRKTFYLSQNLRPGEFESFIAGALQTLCDLYFANASVS